MNDMGYCHSHKVTTKSTHLRGTLKMYSEIMLGLSFILSLRQFSLPLHLCNMFKLVNIIRKVQTFAAGCEMQFLS